MDFLTRIENETARLTRLNLNRVLKTTKALGRNSGCDGLEMLNLSSNDYLGLSSRAELANEFLDSRRNLMAPDIFPLSAVSSRLLTGNHPEYAAIETFLGDLYGGRAALAANSGYHANIGLIPALAGEGDLIVSDSLNHASIIDGIRLSRAERAVYPHLDLGRAEEIVAAASGRYRNVFLITESVFSMDGDVVDLTRLVEIRRRHGVALIVDEAHAVGVFGAGGLGVCEEAGVMAEVDVIVGTFGKAFCSSGAYMICEPVVREYLVSTMRSLLYTTGLPPITVAWSRFVVERAVGMDAERKHLAKLGERLRAGLAERGYTTGGSSQIVPLIVGDSSRAITLAASLRERGYLTFPIRPPTVPEGSARIRFSLNAGLSERDIHGLLSALDEVDRV